MSKPRHATNLSNLINRAKERGDYATASNGRWHARRGAVTMYTNPMHGGWIVRHHSTDLFRVSDVDTIVPINPGWRSVTDKQGTNKILRGAGFQDTYDSLFPKVVKEPEPVYKEPEPNYEPFQPPISVSDTIM